MSTPSREQGMSSKNARKYRRLYKKDLPPIWHGRVRMLEQIEREFTTLPGQLEHARAVAQSFERDCAEYGIRRVFGGVEIEFDKLIAALGPEQTAELLRVARDHDAP